MDGDGKKGRERAQGDVLLWLRKRGEGAEKENRGKGEENVVVLELQERKAAPERVSWLTRGERESVQAERERAEGEDAH